MKSYNGQGKALGLTAEIDFTPPPGYEWLVDHIAVSCDGTSNCTAAVYLNQRFICGTSVASNDSADGSPIPVRAIDQVRIVWSNESVGANVYATLLVREGIQGQGLTTGT